ncbi:MAG: T9SS C-terminal target domain-containing protein, partial [Chitinophagia bacterium]|nr:T9SS C-terminal target domain-containing protein [Chitinophagia bacterium]
MSYYTVAEEQSYFNASHVGVYFDDGTIDSTHQPGTIQRQYTPQIDDTTVITDTVNWVKRGGIFTANGTERFFTVGNFRSMYTTQTIPSLGANHWYGTERVCWNLSDDFALIDCANEPLAGMDTTLHVGDTVHLGPNETTLPYTWYQQGSTMPIDSGGGITVHPTVTTTYILKQDLCGSVKYDTVTITVHNLGLA